MKNTFYFWLVISFGAVFLTLYLYYELYLTGWSVMYLEDVSRWIMFYKGIILALLIVIFSLLITAAAVYRKKSIRLKAYYETYIKNIEYANEMDWKQIAGELHDSLGQNLLVANSEIKQLEKSSANGNAGKLKDVSDILISSVDEIRRISARLHPYHLERFGLKKAVETMIDTVSKSTNIQFNVTIDKIDNIFEPEAEFSIYRIIQECLNNITKHSKASEVSVEIYLNQIYLNIKIQDNGVGFDMRDVENGLGLLNMEQRVHVMHGTIDITTGINEGTMLMITLPIKYISIKL